tara:strand:+ start:879 stop:1316 length:438 start_codon:yes stop_codon:yes gene_type:complete
MVENKFDDLQIKTILSKIKVIGLVGASDNPEKPSNIVMKYLQTRGYKVIPVNPTKANMKIHNELCYSSLLDIPFSIDMVDVFRRSEECLEIAKQAIQINAKVFWMQLNIFNKEAFNLVKKNNLQCVYNKCPKIEYSRIFNELDNI